MDVERDVIRLLGQLGLMAGAYRMAAEAEAITAALEKARPDSENPLIIRALTRMNANDAAGAMRILEEQVLRMNPQNTTAKAFLGLALHMEGRAHDRDRVLNDVVSAGDDESSVALAQSLLNR